MKYIFLFTTLFFLHRVHGQASLQRESDSIFSRYARQAPAVFSPGYYIVAGKNGLPQDKTIVRQWNANTAIIYLASLQAYEALQKTAMLAPAS